MHDIYLPEAKLFRCIWSLALTDQIIKDGTLLLMKWISFNFYKSKRNEWNRDTSVKSEMNRWEAQMYASWISMGSF